jgi:tRNA pseudouridine55 synthase
VARSSLGPGLDGILVVDKPIGPTSHDIVGLVRRLAATKRVGHGGTLDPFASGVLPVFLGRATRVVEFHLADRKAYRATICFGASSTTDDLEGEVTPSDGPAPTREVVEAALPSFTGPISQRPPAYSAIKIGGRRAYAMARAGETVELKEREVVIDSFTIAAWDDSDPERPIAVVDVTCSAGTYVRALARDLGSAVGSSAYLGALRRTAAGSFGEQAAVTLDAVRTATADGPDGLVPLLRPIDAGLDRFPRVELDEGEVDNVAQGQYVKPSGGIPANADHYRLVDRSGRLVAIAIPAGGGRLAPDKVLVDSGQRPASVGA